MDHSHHQCAHLALKFCGHCNTVWCQACKIEWRAWAPCLLNHYPNYYQPYYPTLGTTVGGGFGTSSEGTAGSGTATAVNLTTCSHDVN